MDTSGVSALWYRRSTLQGKVRRRVQDLRMPSSCYSDFIAIRPVLDLSHNESVRLAVDSLLSLGLQGYHEVLNAEGEADFLSELEKAYILRNGKEGNAGCTFSSYVQFSNFLLVFPACCDKKWLIHNSCIVFVLHTASPGESDGDDDKVLEGLSTASQSATLCPAVATGLGQSSIRGIHKSRNLFSYSC